MLSKIISLDVDYLYFFKITNKKNTLIAISAFFNTQTNLSQTNIINLQEQI